MVPDQNVWLNRNGRLNVLRHYFCSIISFHASIHSKHVFKIDIASSFVIYIRPLNSNERHDLMYLKLAPTMAGPIERLSHVTTSSGIILKMWKLILVLFSSMLTTDALQCFGVSCFRALNLNTTYPVAANPRRLRSSRI